MFTKKFNIEAKMTTVPLARVTGLPQGAIQSILFFHMTILTSSHVVGCFWLIILWEPPELEYSS